MLYPVELLAPVLSFYRRSIAERIGESAERDLKHLICILGGWAAGRQVCGNPDVHAIWRYYGTTNDQIHAAV